MSASFSGLFTAIVTPFKSDKSIDKEAYQRHLEYQLEGGVDGVVVCGTTGESPSFDDDEFEYLIHAAADICGDSCKVIAGSGSNSTKKSIRRSQIAEDVGADGLLVVAPYYNKPTQGGLIEHFRQIADRVKVPLMLYNVPGRTSVNILPETIEELSAHENIVSVKEASGDLQQVNRIKSLVPDHFTVLSGDDPLTLPMIALGCHGLVSVASNQAPKLMKRYVDSCLNKDLDTARELHFKLLPLMNANFWESNPGPVKAALNKMGKMENVLRLPLIPMTKELEPRMEAILTDLNLL